MSLFTNWKKKCRELEIDNAKLHHERMVLTMQLDLNRHDIDRRLARIEEKLFRQKLPNKFKLFILPRGPVNEQALFPFKVGETKH